MSDGQTNLTLRQRQSAKPAATGGMVAGGIVADDMRGPKQSAGRRNFRRLAAAAAIVLLLAGAVWAWIYFHPGIDPRLQEVLALQSQMSKLATPISKEAFELQRQVEAKMRDLPQDLKDQARKNGQNLFQARFDRFFAMSAKDQLAELDKIILGIQALQQMQNLKNALGGQTNNGHPPGPAGRSDAQRAQFVQRMIADHPPAQRAQFTLGRQMFQARMQQQGVTIGGGFF